MTRMSNGINSVNVLVALNMDRRIGGRPVLSAVEISSLATRAWYAS